MRNICTSFIIHFDARTPWFGAGRTAIALGQLSILLFASSTSLMVPVLGRPDAPYCDGVKTISLYCMGDVPHHTWRWVFIAILLIVASGISPRLTAVPHAWVSFSLNQSIALPDGGESVAQVITLLLIPVCLVDDRKWHWVQPERTYPPIARGVSAATSLMIRLQMAAIYLNSGIAKLATPAWLDGSAEYYIVRDKNFGTSGIVDPVMRWLTSYPLGSASITWGTILLECVLAVLILGTSRMRLLALIAGAGLHLAIILTIGLWSFSAIMIGGLLIVAGSGNTSAIGVVSRWRRRYDQARSPEVIYER